MEELDPILEGVETPQKAELNLDGDIVLPVVDRKIIKVLGVGGGGCNAVNYMYRTGIRDVSFLVCNTDVAALQKSDVPDKLAIAELGAGGRPEVAKSFAEENKERIKNALSDGTKMVFVTAGMGGGTGTGASPVVAEIAQSLGILTVGIVTIPFEFEGKRKIRKALEGVKNLAEHVDALLIINNEKLKQIYPDFDLPNAFAKADEVLCNAAKSIAEIITVTGYINTDFQDVYNTLKDGGVAIMNVGHASGEDESQPRITYAIQDALNSPLVFTSDVKGANRILLNFYCSHDNAIAMKELDQINSFIDEVGDDIEVNWGASYDDTMGKNVRVTIIATGYEVKDIPGIEGFYQKPVEVPVDIVPPFTEEMMPTPAQAPVTEQTTTEAETIEPAANVEIPEIPEVPETSDNSDNEEDSEDEDIVDLSFGAAPEPEVPQPRIRDPYPSFDDYKIEEEKPRERRPFWRRNR